MLYIGIILCIALCTFVGYCAGKYNRKYPRNRIVLDLDTFEYLRERDEELWEIEKIGRAENKDVKTYYVKSRQIVVTNEEPITH